MQRNPAYLPISPEVGYPGSQGSGAAQRPAWEEAERGGIALRKMHTAMWENFLKCSFSIDSETLESHSLKQLSSIHHVLGAALATFIGFPSSCCPTPSVLSRSQPGVLRSLREPHVFLASTQRRALLGSHRRCRGMQPGQPLSPALCSKAIKWVSMTPSHLSAWSPAWYHRNCVSGQKWLG